MTNLSCVLIFTAIVGVGCAMHADAADMPRTHPANGKLKVFVLAGQSNMVGFGQLKPRGEQSAVGTMEGHVAENPERYGHLVEQDGQYVVRDDVWIVNLTRDEQKGWLTVGFGAGGGHIGPEYAFGFMVGDYFEDPVVIIKSAWGGRSLAHNFLPPSAAEYPAPEKDGDMGFQYAEVVRHVKDITGNLEKYFPDYAGQGHEIVGFGWHQGWNDRINQDAVNAYEQNMAHFIRDMRRDLGVADLPFVIANTGIGGWDIVERHKVRVEKLMNDQLALGDPEKHPEFAGTVAGVETRGFWRTREQSPSGQGFHWHRNWETYYLIGEAMGKAMISMIDVRKQVD